MLSWPSRSVEVTQEVKDIQSKTSSGPSCILPHRTTSKRLWCWRQKQSSTGGRTCSKSNIAGDNRWWSSHSQCSSPDKACRTITGHHDGGTASLAGTISSRARDSGGGQSEENRSEQDGWSHRVSVRVRSVVVRSLRICRWVWIWLSKIGEGLSRWFSWS